MEPLVLQQELIELLLLLQNLNTAQIKVLLSFVQTPQDAWFPQTLLFLQKASPKQIEVRFKSK